MTPNLRIIAGKAADAAARGPSDRLEWRDEWEEGRAGAVCVGRLLLFLAFAILGAVLWALKH